MDHLNQKGLTLLEVLLSIVILMIILATFMKFFPQMGMMNKQNQEKQQAVYDAKEILLDWQGEGENLKKFLANPSNGDLPGYTHSDATFYYFEDKWAEQNIEIKIKKTSDLNTNPTKPFLVHIKLKNKRDNTISETYGYIVVK